MRPSEVTRDSDRAESEERMLGKWIIVSILSCVAGYVSGYFANYQERCNIKRKIKFIKDWEEQNNDER